MRTRSFGTIIVGGICVHPGYRMGQEYRHVETQNIEFGNSSAENGLNICLLYTSFVKLNGFFTYIICTSPFLYFVNHSFLTKNC